MKTQTKRVTSSLIILVGLVITALSFQNCSTGSASGDSDQASSLQSSITPLTYPTSQLNLVAGQTITLKIAQPAAMPDTTNYFWLIYGDNNTFVAHYGMPVASGGSVYISLSVRSTITTQSILRVYFYNYATGAYLDGDGIIVSISPTTASQFTTDAVGDLCQLTTAVPTVNLDRTQTADLALTTFDNGGGIGSLSCNFTDSVGNTTSVDCTNAASWPSTWVSSTITVTATNRCGQSASSTFNP